VGASKPFSTDDAYRALDSAGRLLTAVSSPQSDEIEKMKMELLRLRFDEQVRGEKRKSAGTAIESTASGNLKPWREVVTPHKDVASGRYQQAEFAADLWQVHLGEGTDEYKNPAEFFRRTYEPVVGDVGPSWPSARTRPTRSYVPFLPSLYALEPDVDVNGRLAPAVEDGAGSRR
jgi:hypothetical protein